MFPLVSSFAKKRRTTVIHHIMLVEEFEYKYSYMVFAYHEIQWLTQNAHAHVQLLDLCLTSIMWDYQLLVIFQEVMEQCYAFSSPPVAFATCNVKCHHLWYSRTDIEQILYNTLIDTKSHPGFFKKCNFIFFFVNRFGFFLD